MLKLKLYQSEYQHPETKIWHSFDEQVARNKDEALEMLYAQEKNGRKLNFKITNVLYELSLDDDDDLETIADSAWYESANVSDSDFPDYAKTYFKNNGYWA